MKIKKIVFFSIIILLSVILTNELIKEDYKNNYSSSEFLTSNSSDGFTFDKIKDLQDKYQNNDIKAILNIENEQLYYPVVQGKDNDYYLNHNYYKEVDKLGSIYLDYRSNIDNSKKNLIYGHSSTKQDIYFNILENYYDENYFSKHKYITLETETKIYKYEIFSVYVETSDFTYMNMNFNTNEEWYSHLLKLQNKSLYDTNVILNEEDNILILQTCSNKYEYQKYSKKYLLIVSRRV